MAIPQANFSFITNGLTAVFKDLSTENPTIWAWDFGDSTGTSSERNPLYTYAQPGDYDVTLIATNIDGSSEPFVYTITVNEQNAVSIDDIITFELPASITLDQSKKNYILTKWRLYLQSAFAIADEYLYDESHYTQLQNILLGKLVVYDLIIMEAKAYMASTMNGGGASAGGASGGNVKKIETGPTSAEWYSGSSTLSQLFSPNGEGISPFDEIAGDICGLGNKLRIKLPMCSPFDTKPIVPIKAFSTKYITTHTFTDGSN